MHQGNRPTHLDPRRVPVLGLEQNKDGSWCATMYNPSTNKSFTLTTAITKQGNSWSYREEALVVVSEPQPQEETEPVCLPGLGQPLLCSQGYYTYQCSATKVGHAMCGNWEIGRVVSGRGHRFS